MSACQISFASFAASLLASVQDEPTDCTPPVDEAAAVVVAHPVAVDGGECIRPLKFSWLVTVTFSDGSSRSFRWYRRAAALCCMRDFGSAKKELFRCYGYSTWEGWRDVSFPLPLAV